MKKHILLILGIVFISSCSDFGDINESTKSPTVVPAETLFANATKNLYDQMVSTSVNNNIFRLFSQYWTETTYVDEANYDFGRDQPGTHWNILYRDVLKDLDETRVVINSTDDGTSQAVIDNQLAAISILEVYTYHVLVDSFGNVPFTEALDADNVSPAYDDDAAVYAAIIIKLDEAIDMISSSEDTFGEYDLIYFGDASKWLKFANSLKLRLALRMAQVDVTTATTMATEAIASGVFTSNDDNAVFAYLSSSPNTNPIWEDLVESGRADFVGANTIVEIMNDLDDSRRPIYFQENLGTDTYLGGVYGENNTYSDYSHPGTVYEDPTLEGVIIDYSEVQFLMAEAVEMGLISGSAETYYNEGITASFEYWGATDVATYLASADVAYSTAASTWQETISVQKWLALYNRGFEGWSTYRIYGYPAMNIPPVSLEDVPRRYTYPEDEPSINGTSYAAAAAAMGGDLKSSTVFWDVN